jgi:hypothetical protein
MEWKLDFYGNIFYDFVRQNKLYAKLNFGSFSFTQDNIRAQTCLLHNMRCMNFSMNALLNGYITSR